MSTTEALIAAREKREAARAAYLSASAWLRTCKTLGDRTPLDAARLEGAYHRLEDAEEADQDAELAFYAAAQAEADALEADLKASRERRRIA